MDTKNRDIHEITVPALLIRISVSGYEKEYCVDDYFIHSTSEVFRRILFVYPKDYCTIIEESSSKESVEQERKILSLLQESCIQAAKIKTLYRPSFRKILERMFLRPLTHEEILYSEAHIASELCNTVFMDNDPSSAQLVSIKPATVKYSIGDRNDPKGLRLLKIAQIDQKIFLKLGEILGEKEKEDKW